MHESTLEFIRKWRSPVLHDKFLFPIIRKKYDIGLVIKNCPESLLEYLEPWVSTLYVDCNFQRYITNNQPATRFNLQERIKAIDSEKTNDIIIEFDGTKIDQTRFVFLTEHLSDVISDSAEPGEMEYDVFTFKITKIKEYQNDLIKCV